MRVPTESEFKILSALAKEIMGEEALWLVAVSHDETIAILEESAACIKLDYWIDEPLAMLHSYEDDKLCFTDIYQSFDDVSDYVLDNIASQPLYFYDKAEAQKAIDYLETKIKLRDEKK